MICLLDMMCIIHIIGSFLKAEEAGWPSGGRLSKDPTTEEKSIMAMHNPPHDRTQEIAVKRFVAA